MPTGEIVLSLCDRTGVMVEPWAEAGYKCVIVDLQHPPGETQLNDMVTAVGCDLLNWLPPLADYAAVFAFPPCTNLAVSGARWFRGKGLSGLADGLRVVERCHQIAEWTGAPWLLENPVSTLATYWRKPDWSFDPCDFGGYSTSNDKDAYTKKTCVWMGGGDDQAATETS